MRKYLFSHYSDKDKATYEMTKQLVVQAQNSPKPCLPCVEQLYHLSNIQEDPLMANYIRSVAKAVERQERSYLRKILAKKLEDVRIEKQVESFLKSTLTSYTKDFNGDFQLRKGADGAYYLTGIASSNEIDRDGDRMSLQALKTMEQVINSGQLNLYSDHEHGWKDTLGHFTKAEIQHGMLFCEARLEDPARNPQVASLIHKLQTGERLGLSIGGDMDGYQILHEKDASGKAHKVREIKNVKLFEVSVVGLPANASAIVTGVQQR